MFQRNPSKGMVAILTILILYFHSHFHSQSIMYSRTQLLQIAKCHLEVVKGRQTLKTSALYARMISTVVTCTPSTILFVLQYHCNMLFCSCFFFKLSIQESIQEKQAYMTVFCVHILLSLPFSPISTTNNCQSLDQFPLTSGKLRSQNIQVPLHFLKDLFITREILKSSPPKQCPVKLRLQEKQNY